MESSQMKNYHNAVTGEYAVYTHAARWQLANCDCANLTVDNCTGHMHPRTLLILEESMLDSSGIPNDHSFVVDRPSTSMVHAFTPRIDDLCLVND